jgi:uncharacterized protein
MSKQTQLQPAQRPDCQPLLDALCREHADIRGALVSTIDGFEVAASVNASVSPKKLAAMTSSLLALGEAIPSWIPTAA